MTTSLSSPFDVDARIASDSVSRVRLGFEVESQLHRSGYLALQDVSCDVLLEETVRLYGQVPNHYLKQVAQEIARAVEGVRDVLNQIEVVAPSERPPLGPDRVSAGADRSHRTRG